MNDKNKLLKDNSYICKKETQNINKFPTLNKKINKIVHGPKKKRDTKFTDKDNSFKICAYISSTMKTIVLKRSLIIFKSSNEVFFLFKTEYSTCEKKRIIK